MRLILKLFLRNRNGRGIQLAIISLFIVNSTGLSQVITNIFTGRIINIFFTKFHKKNTKRKIKLFSYEINVEIHDTRFGVYSYIFNSGNTYFQ